MPNGRTGSEVRVVGDRGRVVGRSHRTPDHPAELVGAFVDGKPIGVVDRRRVDPLVSREVVVRIGIAQIGEREPWTIPIDAVAGFHEGLLILGEREHAADARRGQVERRRLDLWKVVSLGAGLLRHVVRVLVEPVAQVEGQPRIEPPGIGQVHALGATDGPGLVRNQVDIDLGRPIVVQVENRIVRTKGGGRIVCCSCWNSPPILNEWLPPQPCLK